MSGHGNQDADYLNGRHKEPAPPPLPAPKMPDDYWLHVRGCDCAYCLWERNAGVKEGEHG